MTIKEDMQSRLFTHLSEMKAGEKPYMQAYQARDVARVVVENFFIIDRDELMVPKIAEETGRAPRYLHSFDHNLFPNVQGDDDWSLACEKLMSAIHDIEALELCLEWKEKKDAEDKELENFAYKLYNLTHPLGHWAAFDPETKKEWIEIARNAKKLLA